MERKAPILHVIGVPEEERNWRGQGVQQKKIYEEMAGNFPNLLKTVNPQIEEIQWIPSMRNVNKVTLRHIITRLPKTGGEKVLKAARGKRHVTHR